jgi:hypothetical protein
VVANEEMTDTIAHLFEQTRESGGQPYEPERFLAYLTVPAPKGKRCADTFAGRRRLVRFMHAVQLAFGICFTNEEWENGYSLDEFVALIAAKASKPETAIRLAEKRLRESKVHRVDSPVKFGVFLSPFLVGALLFSQPYLKAILAAVYVTPLGWVVMATQREYSYARKLIDRLHQRGH